MRGVFDDGFERFATVALLVFDLLAKIVGRLSDPGHLSRREVPVGCTRNAGELEVVILMTRGALECGDAMIVLAAKNGRVMRSLLVPL